MNAITFVAGLAVALLGQWLNRYQAVPAEAVKLALAAAGATLYGFLVVHPTAFPPDPAFTAWFDDALLWAFALPGMASLIGLAPGMKTNSKEGNPVKAITGLLVGVFALVVALVVALPTVASAQSTSAPALSFQRVSLGLGADFCLYRPEPQLGLKDSREIRVGLPIAYNLGKSSSLRFGLTYGTTSHVKELTAGIVIHVLARGKLTGGD